MMNGVKTTGSAYISSRWLPSAEAAMIEVEPTMVTK